MKHIVVHIFITIDRQSIGSIILEMVRRIWIFLGFFFVLFVLRLYVAPSFVTASTEPVGLWSLDTSLPYKLANHFSLVTSSGINVMTGSALTYNSHDEVLYSMPNSLGVLDSWQYSLNKYPKKIIWGTGTKNGTYFYGLGGFEEYSSSSHYSNNLVYYATDSLFWSSTTPLPQRLSKGASAIVGNYIYFTGGWTDTEWAGTASNKVYYAPINSDGTLGAWNTTTNLPDVWWDHRMVSYNGYLYIVGGWNTSGVTSSVLRAKANSNGSLGPWTNMASLPKALRAAGVIAYGDYIIVAGGVTNSGELSNLVYYAQIDNTGTITSWNTSVNSLPVNHCCGALAAAGGYLYLTGGYTSGYENRVWKTELNIEIPAPTPTPTPTPVPTLTPIIIIPGLGASWNYDALVHNQSGIADTDWKIAPYVKEYDGLIDSLVNSGYVLNQNLFVYAYDWRHDINQTADNLNTFIESRFPSGTRINLIGHSLGGLIGRIYTFNHNNRINNLYTLGSPHLGAVDVYKIWEGADFSDMTSWEKLGVDLYLRVTQGQYSNTVDQIRSVYPVFIDIWPTFDFLKNNTTMSFSNPIPVNFSPTLTKTLYGTNTNTNRYIKVSPRTALDAINNKWVDGTPAGYETADGDGSVLSSSAQVPNVLLNKDFSGVLHRQLPSDTTVEQFLLTDLGLAGSPAGVSQPNLDKAILVTTASPVNFQVNTPGGIVDPQDGIVVVDNPDNGNYSVKVTPQGAGGDYTLYFGRFNGADVAWDVIQDSVTTGQTDTQNFNVNLSSASLGADPIKQINLYLDEIRPLISNSPSVNNKLILLARLLEIRLRVNSLPFINKQTLFDKQLTEILSDINSFPLSKFTDSEAQQIQSDFNLIKPLLLQYRGDKFGN